MSPLRDQELTNKEIERWYRLRNVRNAAQALVVITILVLIAGYAVSRLFMEKPAETETKANPEAANVSYNLSYSVPGPHPFHVSAEKARMTQARDHIQLSAPVMTYYPKRGGKITLKANAGELNRLTQNYNVSGDVALTYDTVRIDAEELSYSHKDRLVTSASPFTVKAVDMVLRGKKLKFWTETKEVIIEKGVQATLYNVAIFTNKNKSLAQHREKLP